MAQRTDLARGRDLVARWCVLAEQRLDYLTELFETGRWRRYTYAELQQRDKLSLDITWLRDQSLEDSANLPEPDLIAAEIAEDLRAALEQFEAIALDLGADAVMS